MKAHFTLLARYNQWMNEQIYHAAAQLNESQLKQDRGAFFTSILGTLNHNVVGDIIWLKRFANHPEAKQVLQGVHAFPQPTALDELLFTERQSCQQARQRLDELIINLIDELSDDALNGLLTYSNMKGQQASKAFGLLLLHFFNHQTHHRGQLTTLLSQEGLDTGITDLLALIPSH
ncbi:DinB family protein [Marinomonas aquiplantarum]|uniref:Putative damage-inducible protein DinB n=1 Tax=Marinomonas aquiplantarum TaxID=491951 RepID=A0A366CX19_9GAMM|nr:DinB family protein [Marinomonas aquiplantarum]RBO82196.1 putative damage-inducible protein DinB [Marinomonas aquiplantarum]